MSDHALKILKSTRSTASVRWLTMAMYLVAATSIVVQQREETNNGKTTTGAQSDLATVPGKEGTILRVELPASWVGDWHYHTGDVFVYVASGELVVDVEG